MASRKLHSILRNPHEYTLSDFHYHIDRADPTQSFIDMTLQRDGEVVALRFWQPVQMKIEVGFPTPTCGMVFYDRSTDQLEGIGVEVADFEATHGAITFFARQVERLDSAILAAMG